MMRTGSSSPARRGRLGGSTRSSRDMAQAMRIPGSLLSFRRNSRQPGTSAGRDAFFWKAAGHGLRGGRLLASCTSAVSDSWKECSSTRSCGSRTTRPNEQEEVAPTERFGSGQLEVSDPVRRARPSRLASRAGARTLRLRPGGERRATTHETSTPHGLDRGVDAVGALNSPRVSGTLAEGARDL